ncbi:MAG: tail fiber domain-containing protein [Bacteroidia bacterium]
MKKYNLLLILLACLLIKTKIQAQNVGIGTATPTNTLEIKSSVANTSGLRFTNLTSASTQSVSNNLGLSVDGNGDVILVPATASNGWLLTGNSNATATSFLGTTNAFDLIFKAANAEYMRILNTNGNVGIGTATPTEKLDVAGNLKFSGALMPNNIAGTTGQVLTSAGAGVAPTWFTIPATTVSNTITGNNLTTTVNGITGTAIILPATTNTLGSAVNTLTSTVDGIVATAPMVNSVSNTIAGNNLTTTVNGVAGTAVTLPAPPATTNTLSSAVNTLTSTVDGIIATAPMVNSVSNTITGNNLTTTVNGVTGTAVTLPATTNTLGSAVNTLTSTVDGVVATAPMVNSVSNTLTGTNLTTTVNGIAGANLDLSPIISNDWKLLGNAGTVAGTNFLGTTDAQDIVLKTNSVENLRILTANGNVGVGTNAPAERLEVNGKILLTNGYSATNGALVYKNTTDYLFLGPVSGSTNQGATLALYGTTNNEAAIPNPGGIDLSVITASPALRILTSGNVGIGNTTPTEKLDVAGNVKLSGALMPNNLAGAVGNVLLSAGAGVAPTWLATGTTGQVLTSAGAGVAPTWTTNNNWNILGNAGTVVATNFMGTTDNVDVVFKRDNVRAGLLNGSSTSFGVGALNPASTGGFNTALGANSMLNNAAGAFNTAVGVNSLIQNTAGVGNIAVGYTSMLNNTVGNYNTAIGYESVYNNLSGTENVGVGRGALYSNTAGTNNTATGANSLLRNTTGNDNVAVGQSSMHENVVGSYNTSIGLSAMYNSLGDNNTAVGAGAGTGNVAGSSNTFVGFFAEPTGTSFTNATAIGNQAKVGASNSLILGGTGGNAVNVGINLTTPAYKLHVRGDITAEDGAYTRSLFNVGYSAAAVISDILEPWTDNGFKLYDGNSNSHIHIESVGTGNIQSYSTAGAAKGLLENTSYSDLYLQNRGAFVAIGTMPAVSKLTVTADGGDGITIQSTGADAGDLIFKEAGGFEKSRIYSNPTAGLTGLVVTTDLTVAGTVTASCGVLVCSDLRYKKDIAPLKGTLSNILKLQGVNYYFKTNEFKEKKFNPNLQIGVIAQDLEKVYPELVSIDSEGYKTVDYSKFTPILIEAIKEQQQHITSLEEQLNQLNAKFEILLKQQQKIK